MEIRKVTFIEPKTREPNVFSFFKHPRLGLPILGAILKRKGYDVKIYVEAIKDIDWGRVFKSDIIGISTDTATTREGYLMADKIGAREIPVVMGGCHVTFLADEALNHCDYVIRGEGEETIVELLNALEEDRGLEGIRGLSFKMDGEKIHNEGRPSLEDIDIIPDLSLIVGYREHFKRLSRRIFGGSTVISTSRGCPFNCNFCSVVRMFGRRLRFRSIDSVIQDIKQQLELTNCSHIFFVDDNFVVSKERTKNLLNRIIEERFNFTFSVQARVDIAEDKELLDLMKAAGCNQVEIGFESISPQALEEYHKKQTIEQMVYAIRTLQEYKILVHGMFVLGADCDCVHTVRSTADFAIKNGIDTVQFLPLSPLPGTELTDKLSKENRLFVRYPEEFDQGEFGYGVGNYVLIRTRNIKPSLLQREIVRAYEKFYSLGRVIKALQEGKVRTGVFRITGWLLVKKARKDLLKYANWLEEREEYKRPVLKVEKLDVKGHIV